MQQEKLHCVATGLVKTQDFPDIAFTSSPPSP